VSRPQGSDVAGGKAAADEIAARERSVGRLAGPSASERDLQESPALYRRSAFWVILAAIVFATVFALLSWLKYRAYMDARFDLGNMVQAVYNTAHGHFLEITSGEIVPRQMSRLGAHVDPILALFALPWLIWPSPVMLLTLQAAIVATGAWPAFRLGTRITEDPRAGALLAGAFLLYPALGFLVLNEFHQVALATPFLLWAFLYVEESRWGRAAVFLVLAALCKETVPLVIGTMGVYFAIRKRSWRPLVVTVLALAYFAAAVWVIIPHFNGGQSAFIARYGEYGQAAGQVVRTALSDPGRTLGDLLAITNLNYWFQMLWPFGFMSLLSPLTTLIAAPEFILNALSATPFQRRIEFHYTALEIPFLFAAAVLGLMRLWRWLGGRLGGVEKARRAGRVRRDTLALLVLLAALAGNYFLGPLPFALPGARYDGKSYARDGHSAALDGALKLIPSDAVVSVNNNAGAQLSARRIVYVFPYFAGADWVVVDERHPFFYDKEDAKMHRLALGRLAMDTRFQNVYARDGVYVFKRVAPGSAEPGVAPSVPATRPN
jgi:uncharacterized membrane protein